MVVGVCGRDDAGLLVQGLAWGKHSVCGDVVTTWSLSPWNNFSEGRQGLARLAVQGPPSTSREFWSILRLSTPLSAAPDPQPYML